MKEHETVRKMGPGQLKELAATIAGAIPDDLTFEEAEKLFGAKCPLLSDVRCVIKRHAGRTDILHRLNDEAIVIHACDGTRTLSQDVFRTQFGFDWGTNKPGKAMPETAINIYGLRRDATFREIFGSQTNDLRKLVFEQSQIFEFVLTHPNWLDPDWGLFFLFEVDGRYFVARALRVSGEHLEAYFNSFEYNRVWRADDRLRFVVPQLQR